MIFYFGGIIKAVYLANAVGGLISLIVTFAFTYILPAMPGAEATEILGDVNVNLEILE